MRTSSVTLESTDRARRTVYESEMGDDLTNALIELITNADDSYINLDENETSPPTRDIRVDYERHHSEDTIIRVKDRAEGMNRNELKEHIAKEGKLDKNFGKENDKRGFFGCGAKAITYFGETVFESIKEGGYYKLTIPRNRKGEETKLKTDSAEEHRRRLGIPRNRNGTIVTLSVDSSRFRIPLYETLCNELRTSPFLRKIIQDDQRELIVCDLNNDQESKIILEEPEHENIYKEEKVNFENFHGIKEEQYPSLTLKKAPDPDENLAGILITDGKHTVFDYDRLGLAHRPYSQRFYGELECPFIWRLISEYEARETDNSSLTPDGKFQIPKDKNPSSPVKRRRRAGLEKTHPFVKELRGKLKPILESEIQREINQSHSGSPEVESSLKKYMDKMAERLGSLIENFQESEKIKFSVIPSMATIELGERKTFTVKAPGGIKKDTDMLDAEVVVAEGEEKIELNKNDIKLVKEEDRFKGQFNVHSLKEGRATVIVWTEGESEEVSVKVGDKPEEPSREEQVIRLDRKSYRVRSDVSRSTNIKIIVHRGYIQPDESKKVSLALKGGERISEVIKLDPPKPGLNTQSDGYLVAKSKAKGNRGGSGKSGTLIASYNEHKDSASIKVVSEEHRKDKNLPFEIKIESHTEGSKRYLWDRKDEEPDRLIISDTHPSVNRTLNEGPNIKDTKEIRDKLGEIVADAVTTRNLLEDDNFNQNISIDNFVSEYRKKKEEILRKLY